MQANLARPPPSGLLIVFFLILPSEAQPSKVVAAEIAFTYRAAENKVNMAAHFMQHQVQYIIQIVGRLLPRHFCQWRSADPQNGVAWTPK